MGENGRSELLAKEAGIACVIQITVSDDDRGQISASHPCVGQATKKSPPG